MTLPLAIQHRACATRSEVQSSPVQMRDALVAYDKCHPGRTGTPPIDEPAPIHSATTSGARSRADTETGLTHDFCHACAVSCSFEVVRLRIGTVAAAA